MKQLGTFISSITVMVSASLATMPSNAQVQNANPQTTTSQTATSPSGTPQQSSTAAAQQVIKESELKGKTVESKNGEKLGSVHDLVIDSQSGRLDFVIISTGGLAGLGAQLKVAPPAALSLATAKKNIVSLDVGPDEWKGAPSVTKDQIANLGNPSQAQQIYQYYHQTWPAIGAQAKALAQTLSPTGRNPSQAGQQVSLASNLIGKRVVNSQNQDMGKISDLLVDFTNPKTTFAILKPGALITESNKEAGKELFAVPVNAFKMSPESNKAILDVDPGQFQQAPALTETSWTSAPASAGAPQIFRYDPNAGSIGTAPDNSRLNARDRQPGTVTPDNQSENRDDLHITQSIRQAIVKDGNLSTMAKNVKIITTNGKVTLRGPVHTEQEKSEIERLAQQTAGSATVQNEIEVKGD
jgi:sporulation protein YlmC with PRC-barrel domain